MNKLLIGVACAMTMMSMFEVRADLNEDYQRVNAAIEEYMSPFTPVDNLLKANPQEAEKLKELKSYMSRCMTASFGNYEAALKQAKRLSKDIKALEAEIGITPEIKEKQMENVKAGLTEVTFEKLKSMVESNEYISSIDGAVSTYLPDVDINGRKVVLSKSKFPTRLAGAQKMDDGWIVLNDDKHSKQLTKGNIGITINSRRVFLYDPAKVFPEKVDITPYVPSQKIASRLRKIGAK